jgi:fructoselysine-6-P-deglycase FrlB-like protein
VRNLAAHPLIIVGSGGSVTAGDLVLRLHQSFARLPAVVLTPYEFILKPGDDVSAVLLLSAGGGNPDIVNAARHASASNHPVLGGVIGRVGSPLASQLSDCRHAQRIELDLPVINDPLGVNSLVATMALLSRAYATVFGEREMDVEVLALPKRVDGDALDRFSMYLRPDGALQPRTTSHRNAMKPRSAGRCLPITEISRTVATTR